MDNNQFGTKELFSTLEKARLANFDDVNKQDPTGRTILFTACRIGDLSIIKELIKANNNINVVDYCNYTCLTTAYGLGFLDVVRFLIEEKRINKMKLRIELNIQT